MVSDERHVQYTESADGTPIAYERHGLREGPAIIFANGLTTARFFWGPLMAALADRAQLVTWDYKGHGDSAPARSPEGCTIEALADDMSRVMDACGLERASLVGFSMGGQVILEAWRAASGRIDALVPILATPGRIFDHALQPILGPLLHGVVRLAPAPIWRLAFGGVGQAMRPEVAHDVGRLMGLLNGDAPRPVIRSYRHGFRRLDPTTLRAIVQASHAHTAEDLLGSITAPTLVVAGERDPFAPLEVSEGIQRAIPGATLAVVPRGGHTALVEQPEVVNRAVVAFLQDHGLIADAPQPCQRQ